MSATATKPINAYDVALENFDLAANALGLDDNIRAMIKYPERILCVSVPVRMDTGKIVRFEVRDGDILLRNPHDFPPANAQEAAMWEVWRFARPAGLILVKRRSRHATPRTAAGGSQLAVTPPYRTTALLKDR